MAESIHMLPDLAKKDKYEILFPQLEAILEGETDDIANMANIAAALREVFHFFWVGFYNVRRDTLVLGPFQGPIACTRIAYNKGVCGTAWAHKETLIVPDVDRFPEHIACSALSRSEIVVPVFRDGNVIAVLDVDSELVDDFDETDRLYLEKIVALL